MHVVKRYSNRKLYSTKESCYINLEDIQDLVTLGETFTVVCNVSGVDLTKVTIESAVAELALNKMDVDLLKKLLIVTKEVDTELKINYNDTDSLVG